MSSPERKISCLLVVADPVEVSPGSTKPSSLTPNWKELCILYTLTPGGREEFLKALDENIVGHFQGAPYNLRRTD